MKLSQMKKGILEILRKVITNNGIPAVHCEPITVCIILTVWIKNALSGLNGFLVTILVSGVFT